MRLMSHINNVPSVVIHILWVISKEHGCQWQIFKKGDNKIKLKVADIILPKMADLIFWPKPASLIPATLAWVTTASATFSQSSVNFFKKENQFLFKVGSSARITVSNHKVADHHLSNAAVTDTIFLWTNLDVKINAAVELLPKKLEHVKLPPDHVTIHVTSHVTRKTVLCPSFVL